MIGLLLGLQILSAIVLIALILLHSAKGEGLAGIGGTAHLFGSPRGLEEGLDKVTTICAAVFMGLAVLLYLVSTHLS